MAKFIQNFFSDEVKDLLAGTDLCKHLIAMAQVSITDDYTEDNQTKVKLASDLLILLLTGGKKKIFL